MTEQINVNYSKISDLLNESSAKDKVLILALYDVLSRTCKQDKNGCYYFDGDNLDHSDIIMEWHEITHKFIPNNNMRLLKDRGKKMLSYIKFICKQLEHKGIRFETKVFVKNNDDNKRTTFTKHYISGLLV